MLAPGHFSGTENAHDLLKAEPYIRYDRRIWGGRLTDRYLRERGIQPRVRLEIDGLMTIASFVSKGLGISLLPDWVTNVGAVDVADTDIVAWASPDSTYRSAISSERSTEQADRGIHPPCEVCVSIRKRMITSMKKKGCEEAAARCLVTNKA